jgi:ABC-2 type transport system ATP-binding protein
MSDAVIEIRNLTKVYSQSHLGRTRRSRGVTDLNLEINRGEVFGLLGLNGSGKTTTLKLLLGLLFPTSGEIRVLGERMPHARAQEKIGYLPEVPYFYRNLNPVEVLTLYGSLSRVDSKKLPARIDQVLKMVNMEHARGKTMKEFSKGMLQRIGLAQAILHDPDILILDEPVTGLDPLGIRQSRQLVTDLNTAGKTIFFSSHSISELERLAHRVGIIIEGKLAALLPRSEWESKPGRLEEIFVRTLEESGTSLVR